MEDTDSPRSKSVSSLTIYSPSCMKLGKNVMQTGNRKLYRALPSSAICDNQFKMYVLYAIHTRIFVLPPALHIKVSSFKSFSLTSKQSEDQNYFRPGSQQSGWGLREDRDKTLTLHLDFGAHIPKPLCTGSDHTPRGNYQITWFFLY